MLFDSIHIVTPIFRHDRSLHLALSEWYVEIITNRRSQWPEDNISK